MKEAEALLERIGERMERKREFEFWQFLEEMQGVAERIDGGVVGRVEEVVLIEGKVFVGRNSVVKAGTRVEGNAFIGENCKVGPNAYLRGAVLLGDNCVVSNSEVKNAVLLRGAKVPHFSYVGDSILGKDVNLGAGTKIANLRFDGKNIKVCIGGKMVDSGRRKLGALLHEGVKTGVNSTINCGLILGRGTFVNPNACVSTNTEEKAFVRK